jgi:mannitol-specific phosphotransferase system IIBC component
VKLAGIIGIAVLSLAIAAPVYAQQEQHDQDEQKAKPEEKKAQPEKSAKQDEKGAQEECLGSA